jgi:lipoate-protein ligase A
MKYPFQKWQLLITPPSPGGWNMAVDETIMELVDQNEAVPCLRLYAWEPPCLSIGYAQTFSDINLLLLANLGWDWVRRPTGGRAILHTDELTYSVIAPSSDPRLTGGVLESYRRLSPALLTALHILNIPAISQPGKISNSQFNGAVCFEVPSNYEITVDGKKLIGSAQARRKNVVLQHGTFPLSGDLTRIIQVLSFPDEQTRQTARLRLLSHSTTAEQVLGRGITWQDAANAFISGFQTELSLEFIPASLSPQVITRAEHLLRKKYAHPAWLKRI